MMFEYLEKIITIDSGENGPTVTLMGGVHGNESCGVEILNKLKNKLKIKRGKVFIIFGNPKAIKKNIRQTQENLNRIFREEKDLTQKEKKSYEYKRSREIIPFLIKSDILLDLHSSYTQKSIPFIICEKNSLDLAKILPSSVVCFGFDDIHPGSTDYFMNKKKKKGICIECGATGSKKANKIARVSVNAVLSYLKMVDTKSKSQIKNNQQSLRVSSIYKTKTNNFTLRKKFNDFEKVKEGELIGVDGKEKIYSDSSQAIVFAGNCNKIGSEAFVLLRVVDK